MLSVALLVCAGAIVYDRSSPVERHEVLRGIYTPGFAPVPPSPGTAAAIRQLWNNLTSASGGSFLQHGLPTQAGALWLSLLVALAVGAHSPPRRSIYVDLLAMQALGFLFYNVLSFLDLLLRPAYVWLMDWVFTAVFAVSVYLIVRALWRTGRPSPERWTPVLPAHALVAIALLLFTIDLGAAAIRPPDDAGYFVNLGAQRLRERHLLPYGDPLLSGTAGAGYGPLLYVAHVPFQIALDPHGVNAQSSPMPPMGADSTYRLPTPLATKLCAIAFHTLGVIALFAIGRRYGSREIAWALVALYCGSAAIIGVGGDQYFVGGMTFISHIAPGALLLAAVALAHRPVAAGVTLVAATGCGFFPAFLVPAWAGHYWDRRADRWRFLIAVAVAGVALLAFVLAHSRPAHGRGLIGTILWDTFGHHSDPAGYGSSPFGFWGQRGGLRGWLAAPLAGASGLMAPMFLMFLVLALAGFPLARRRQGIAPLALVSAAIVIAANLIKIHSTGTYIAWFYGLLLAGLLLQ